MLRRETYRVIGAPFWAVQDGDSGARAPRSLTAHAVDHACDFQLIVSKIMAFSKVDPLALDACEG